MKSMILGISASPQKGGKVETLVQEVKKKAFSLGAHLVGIAPISRMKNAPPELNPKRLLPEAKSLISMAYRINRGVQQVHLRGVSPMSFSRVAGLEPKFRLDDMALDLANFLEDLDYISLPMPVIDEEDDAKQAQLEFLLAGENRFPWDRTTRGAFAYNACSKCYVVCHPENLKKEKYCNATYLAPSFSA